MMEWCLRKMTMRMHFFAVIGFHLISNGTVFAQGPSAPPPQPLPHPDLPLPPLPPAFLPTWIWLAIGVLAGVVVALIAALIWLRPKAEPPPAANPRRVALAALKKLRAEVAQLAPSESGHRVSMILRTYLERRYRIPATALTTRELFAAERNTRNAAVSVKSGGQLELRSPLAAKAAASGLAPYAPLAEWWDRLAFAPLPATSQQATELVETVTKRVEEDFG